MKLIDQFQGTHQVVKSRSLIDRLQLEVAGCKVTVDAASNNTTRYDL